MGAKLSGGGGKKKGYAPNNEPNVIPFIDILLVLLIIFMVAAPPPTTDVKVDLPPPNAEPTPDPKRPTVVDVRDAGGVPQIFVDGQLTEEPQLVEVVTKQIAFNNPGTPNPLLETIRVRADQTLSYQTVMRVMGDLQEAQFTKVSLVAEEALPEGASAPAQ